MNGIWFFDDWMLERRDCLERVWGKPTFVKEIFTTYPPAGWDGYGGFLTCFFDERLGRYVMYLINFPGRGAKNRTPGIAAGEFQFRLQSDDPCSWPTPSYDSSAALAWEGFEDVVIDQEGKPIMRPMQATEMQIEVEEVMRDKKRMLEGFASFTGRSIDQLKKDFGRDFYLTAPEAKEYGVIDQILMPKRPSKLAMSKDDIQLVG